jgi:multicomponent Na+:H+ antiporter subunit C
VNLLVHYNQQVVVVLMMTGFYVIMARNDLVKKLLGLSVFQAAVILMYVSMGKVTGGTAAILMEPLGHGAGDAGDHGGAHAAEGAAHVATAVYSNPLPHVLMLTAIVVGVATMAVGLALVVRIHEAYGTTDDAELRALDAADDAALRQGSGG